MLFDLSDYRLRKLDPAQGTKPLDFGGGGITGSVNLDGRFIAINTHHPEHGYITLTSIPPFPDTDRYNQPKVRAYRKSMVDNQGFGLEFEQGISAREYYLIEGILPFMRFTFADGETAECLTLTDGYARQIWRFSASDIVAQFSGDVWLMRTSYTQLTEGGILEMPNRNAQIASSDNQLILKNEALYSVAAFDTAHIEATLNDSGSVALHQAISGVDHYQVSIQMSYQTEAIVAPPDVDIDKVLSTLQTRFAGIDDHPIIRRASVYADICYLQTGKQEAALLTDHMILPLSWNRDAYYTAKRFPNRVVQSTYYLSWLLKSTWRGTYCRRLQKPNADGWGRSYMANGQQKDSRSFQLDQQIFPLLTFVDVYQLTYGYADPSSEDVHAFKAYYLPYILRILDVIKHSASDFGLYVTDETPADDDIPLPFHFSSHILLWYALKRVANVYPEQSIQTWIDTLTEQISTYFVSEHNGKSIYAYATDGKGNAYHYHDANDIPLVMMPLWGFCDKDDLLWRNTIDFSFSDDNLGFYGGVLGSVHTPASWALGDAQELILSKVLGDKARYQRVWERVQKAAQWDGALSEAYDATTFEVVSRHWFAWTNAMIAIAHDLSWDWENEGDYAR